MTASCSEYNYNNPLPCNGFLRMLQETVCFAFSCIIVRGYNASTLSFKFQLPSSPSADIVSFSTWEWRRRCEESKKGTKCSTYVKRLICEIHSVLPQKFPKWKQSKIKALATSSSTVAQQPTLGQGLPQKLLPSVPISCGTPPMFFPQLPGITRHSIFPS